MPNPLPPAGLALPSQPATFAALQAMQSIILAECLVGGASPFAALSAADAARYGVANAVFVGRPKDFNDAYLPQCCIWIPPEHETAALIDSAGRADADFEARVQVFVDPRPDWYAAEQQIMGIRDALWSAVARHTRLGGSVTSVAESAPSPGRGLCYEYVAGSEYRCYEAAWWVRQQWSIAGGRAL
jgi:hypothetical protein